MWRKLGLATISGKVLSSNKEDEGFGISLSPKQAQKTISGNGGVVPLPYLIRIYSESSVRFQAPEDLSYILTLAVWKSQLHCTFHIIGMYHFSFWMSILNSRTFVAKMKLLLRVRRLFQPLTHQVNFSEGYSDESEELVFFPNLWAKVKMTWKQFDTRDFLKSKRMFQYSVLPCLPCIHLCLPLQLHLQVV